MFVLIFNWLKSKIFGQLGNLVLYAVFAVGIIFMAQHWIKTSNKQAAAIERINIENQQLHETNHQLGQSVVVMDKLNEQLDKTTNMHFDFNQHIEKDISEIITNKQIQIEKTKVIYVSQPEKNKQQDLSSDVGKIQISAIWEAYCRSNQNPKCIINKDIK